MLFGALFAKKTAVVSSENFRRVNETSWALDLASGGMPYWECKDACFFLSSTQRAWENERARTRGARARNGAESGD